MSASTSVARTARASHVQRFLPFVANTVFAIALVTLTDILSPIYPRVLETWYSDQYIFELTGKMWAEGGIPYVDFWDQKGPLIFLFNMIGWKLTGSALGIFILTACWSAITVNMLYLIAKVFVPERHATVLPVLIAWISAAWIGFLCAPSWNLIEPLCLPFLAFSLLIAVRWLAHAERNATASLPWWHAFVYGLSFSVCLLSRLTNALSVCVIVLVITVMLVMRKQWKTLLISVVSFLASIATLLLPFCIYFVAHHAFYEFIYGTLLFNMSYAGNAEGLLSAQFNTLVLIICVPVAMVIFALAHIVFIASQQHKKYISAIDCTMLINGILFLALFFKISPYQHYAAIATIFLPVLLGYASQLIAKQWQVIVAAVLILAILCGYHAKVDNKLIWSEPVYNEPELEQVINQADGDVVLYNVLVGAYLQYDLKPMYRFAWLQDWEASFSDSYQSMLQEEFSTARAQYIVVQPYYTMPEPAITDILNRYYEPSQTITVEGIDTVVYKRK